MRVQLGESGKPLSMTLEKGTPVVNHVGVSYYGLTVSPDGRTLRKPKVGSMPRVEDTIVPFLSGRSNRFYWSVWAHLNDPSRWRASLCPLCRFWGFRPCRFYRNRPSNEQIYLKTCDYEVLWICFLNTLSLGWV
jgi:hypothetical protein